MKLNTRRKQSVRPKIVDMFECKMQNKPMLRDGEGGRK